MKSIYIKKLANAFYPTANPSKVVNGVAFRAVDRFRKKHKGLWVGGSVILTDSGIEFCANGMNEKLHDNVAEISIPSGEIISITRKFGWLTGIVVISHNAGEFRFRCFGAKTVADAYSSYLSQL